MAGPCFTGRSLPRGMGPKCRTRHSDCQVVRSMSPAPHWALTLAFHQGLPLPSIPPPPPAHYLALDWDRNSQHYLQEEIQNQRLLGLEGTLTVTPSKDRSWSVSPFCSIFPSSWLAVVQEQLLMEIRSLCRCRLLSQDYSCKCQSTSRLDSPRGLTVHYSPS